MSNRNQARQAIRELRKQRIQHKLNQNAQVARWIETFTYARQAAQITE